MNKQDSNVNTHHDSNTLGQRIFDSDRHVMEPLEIWQQYVDADVYRRFPINMVLDTPQAAAKRVEQYGQHAGIAIPPTFLIGDEPILFRWDVQLQLASANKKGSSIQRKQAMTGAGQLASMAVDNITQASIFSTFAGFIVNHKSLDAEASLAYAQGYNRWLYDYCQADRSKLLGVGLISRHDPQNMVSQLDTIINYGWRAITIRPEMIKQRTLAHPDYEPFWRACADNNIAIAFHGGTHLQAPTVGYDRFTSRFGLHACSHPMEAQMAFVSLLESGVFERHPSLKFAFLEAGASWVPHWLWRLDNICYPEFSQLTAEHIKMLPSEYFKRQCWVAIEVEEPCLAETVKMIGADKLLFGTDFPHPDHLDIDISDIKSSCQGLNEQQVIDMLEQNAKDFFGY